jgi:signal transduction histidine kinase
MVEGVIASDARGHITTANAAARELMGYANGDALPDVQTLFRAKAAREVVDAALEGASEQSRTVELDDRTLLLNARALPEGGAVIVLHDLTDVRRLENVRRDFVANVSHELKTPLTSISGYAETLLTDPPDQATVQRFLGTILANSRRMHRLVDDLLDLSRIESGHWQPSPGPLSAGGAVRDAVGLHADHAAERAVDLKADSPATEIVFQADAEAVRQVLSNLIDNALRYTPAGGSITVRAEDVDDGVRLSVADTGAGIPQEHLPRIFERFYRADPSRSREEGGTGLGLSIVRHLVESHGGRVSAESTLGQGTVISCWFPKG